MSKVFGITLDIILFIVSFILLLFGKYSYITILCSLAAYVVLFGVYRLCYKLDGKSQRTIRKLVALFLVLFVILQFIMQKNSSIFSDFSIFINILNVVLVYLFVERRVSIRDSVYIVLCSFLYIPLISGNINNSLAGLILTFYVYSLISIEYGKVFNLKQVIKYALIGIFLGLLYVINPYFCLSICFFVFMMIRNVGVKNTLMISTVILMFFGVSYLLINAYWIHFIQNDSIVLYNEFSTVSLLLCVMQAAVFSLWALFSNQYQFEHIRANNFFACEIAIVLGVSLISKLNYMPYLVGISLIFYSIPNYQIRFLPKINYLKRYIKPRKVEKVSVVIPNYNYENYICQRIDSVIDQTYPVFEVIVLDDCSSDNSCEVIENKISEVKQKYPKMQIKFIPNEKNSGNVFKQWQKAFELSSGDYLWIAEADDLCDKHFLNVAMQGFKNDKVVLSYTESKAIDGDGICFFEDMRLWIDQFNSHHYLKSYINDGKKEMEEVLCTNNTIPNASGVIFKKVPTIDIKKYLSEAQAFKLAGDWYFYYKYLLHGSISYSSDSLNYHRIHRNSVTTTTDSYLRYCEIRKIQNSISSDVELTKNAKCRIDQMRERLQKELCISKEELRYENVSLEEICRNKHITSEILLSVIIPVYNTEPYLKRCFNSFIKTLPEKTEVIIINDESPDNSENIIQEYAEKYSQIRYIKKKNGGLSSVKNVGLKEAKGEYIIFLDSDDYVSSNMYSTMLKKAIDTNSDIVCCDVMSVYDDGKIEYSSSINYSRVGLMRLIDNPIMAASWSKMVKKSLYNDLQFPEGINNEDVAITPLLFLKSQKTTCIPSPFYKYVQRSGSIQNSGFNEKRFVIFDTSKMCLKSVEKYGRVVYEQVQATIVTHQLIAVLVYLIGGIRDEVKRQIYIEMFCNRFNDMEFLIDPRENVFVKEYMHYSNLTELLENIICSNYASINDEIGKKNI